jgi:hypothetical protein
VLYQHGNAAIQREDIRGQGSTKGKKSKRNYHTDKEGVPQTSRIGLADCAVRGSIALSGFSQNHILALATLVSGKWQP